jgi:high-affinity nickel-transport protein
MCLLDTADGALMLSLYIQPATNFLPAKQESKKSAYAAHIDRSVVNPTGQQSSALRDDDGRQVQVEDGTALAVDPAENQNPRDPIAFLYYSIVLTTLTVIVALVIGILQLLTLILNVAQPTGTFWDGVQTAGDYYDVIGGCICGCFLVFGLLSVVLYKPWRRWIARREMKRRLVDEEVVVVHGRDGGRTAVEAIASADIDADHDGITVAGGDSSIRQCSKPSAVFPSKGNDKTGSTEIAIHATDN